MTKEMNEPRTRNSYRRKRRERRISGLIRSCRVTRNFGTPLGVAMSIERRWLVDLCPIPAQFPEGKLGGNWGWSLRAGAPIDMATPNGVPTGKLDGNWGWSFRTGASIDMATPNGFRPDNAQAVQ